MIIVAVSGPGASAVAGELSRMLGVRASVSIATGGTRADVLVSLGGELPYGVKAPTVICAEPEGANAARRCGAQSVVTVGMNSKDTVTPSSVLDGCMAALQRELVCVDGSIIEPREVNLSGIQGSVVQRMAVAAAAMISGYSGDW